jgi:hypothetical protein
MLSVFLVQDAYAGIGGPISAEKTMPTERGRDIGKIKRSLSRETVSARLEKIGYDAEQIKAHLDLLSDEELQELAGGVEEIESGGFLWDLIFLLLIILLIIYLIDVINRPRVY